VGIRPASGHRPARLRAYPALEPPTGPPAVCCNGARLRAPPRITAQMLIPLRCRFADNHEIRQAAVRAGPTWDGGARLELRQASRTGHWSPVGRASGSACRVGYISATSNSWP